MRFHHYHYHHHLLLSAPTRVYRGACTQRDVFQAPSAWPPIVLDFYAALWTRTDVDSSTWYADTIDTSREGLAWLAERGLMSEAAVENANEKGSSGESELPVHPHLPPLLPTSIHFLLNTLDPPST
jgi:hypothetical protein